MRAPHKPLLLLMALARLQRREDPWLAYEAIENIARLLPWALGRIAAPR